MKCLQVQKNESIEKAKWQNFYSSIEGFKFEPGYIYKLSVSEEKINPAQVPTDGSSIKYTLVEVLEKIPDPKFRIHDIWIVEAINDTLVPQPVESRTMLMPVIRINVTEMWVTGTDRCNRFWGPINILDDEKLKLGAIFRQEILCNRMEIADKFNVAINKVSKYKIENLKLYFYDDAAAELLRFKKVD